MNKLPVWKVGHIASEPEEDFDGQPRFLIDITGRKGMSGSPVIAGHMELHFSKTGLPRMRASGRLLGIYASNALRFTDDDAFIEERSLEEVDLESGSTQEMRPELGFVWKAHLISEITSALRIEEFANRVWAEQPPPAKGARHRT